MKANNKVVLGAALAAGALMLAGCGTSQEEAAENTANDNAALCQSLQALEASLDQVRAGAASAATSSDSVTVGDAQNALTAIQKGWQQVKSDASDLSQSVGDQMDMALSDYQDALSGIDAEDSLAAAKGQVASAQSDLRQSYQEIRSQLGC